MIEPPSVSLPDTAPDDPRCGHLITASPSNPSHVIIGFKSDEGVRRNGGRTGAAIAPDLIRRALYKLTPDAMTYEAHCNVLRDTIDAGNIPCTGNLEEDQEVLGRETAAWLSKGIRPIILGGGHETAYGHFLGYVATQQAVQIINIDAHADVRPLKNGQAHSGSPFRQALEHPSQACIGYHVYGLARWSTAHAHIEYLERNRGLYLWDSETVPHAMDSVFGNVENPTMVTVDMDVINAAEAPGVSAPATVGIPLTTVFHACSLAGRSPTVGSIDIVEVNPIWDIDQQTVKAAALCVWHFLKGAADRGNH